MERLEFYIFESELWCKSDDGKNFIVTENDTEIVSQIFIIINERYPKAFEALQKCYQKSALNTKYYQFLIVRRFCKCNFGSLDSTSFDVCDNGNMNFEKVNCPLRGECQYEGVICSPVFNSKLSDAELRVMELVYNGYPKEEIAETLYLSPNTIKNHIKSVYCKLGIHEKSEFIRYANQNHLFNNNV